jgi:glyoxylase-like metal-dependent hydrolase (beta-lactamase superfamily II)
MYLWHDGDSLVLIDTGAPGGGATIAKGIQGLGFEPGDLTGIVLTHFHADHAGAAAEIRELSGAPLIAHRDDAPIIRGEAPPPPAVLEDWERPIFEQASKDLPPVAPPAVVDLEVTGGEVLESCGGARIISVPGHTDGSLAVYFPRRRTLFTGDTIANVQKLMLGVFNLDRARTVASFHRLAELDVETACFGHGEPIPSGAGKRLREVAATLG